jgi:hypothetical protein
MLVIFRALKEIKVIREREVFQESQDSQAFQEIQEKTGQHSHLV